MCRFRLFVENHSLTRLRIAAIYIFLLALMPCYAIRLNLRSFFDAIGQHPEVSRFVLCLISCYNSANLCPSVFPSSVCPSFCLSLDLHENRSHDSLQTRPMWCPEPVDVQYDFSLYGRGKIIELNDFCVLFAVPSPLMLLSVIPPTVADSIAILAGDTGRSYTADFPSEQSADNPDFTVCIIRCVYRAKLIRGR